MAGRSRGHGMASDALDLARGVDTIVDAAS